MPAPTVTVRVPPPVKYFDPGILRPQALVAWTGGTGPFDVLHEWDTVNTFDSGALIQDSNTGVASPNTGTPPSDMGPAGTLWYYRATVTDTSDAATTTSSPTAITWGDPVAYRRYLYELANVGVGFDPTDTPAGGWGPDPDEIGPDGHVNDFRRYLYQLANITSDTPTPHIWYVFPAFGREGWEFQIVGYGFGDTQATFSGSVTLTDLAVGVISWELVAETSTDLTIDPVQNIAEPVHQLIRASVPEDAESGLVVVCTDGP